MDKPQGDGQPESVKINSYQATVLAAVMGNEMIAFEKLPPTQQVRVLLDAFCNYISSQQRRIEATAGDAPPAHEQSLADAPTREIMRVLARRMRGEDWRQIWPRLKVGGAYATVLGIAGRRALRRKAAPKT